MQPVVSVLLPFYNTEITLHRAIESIVTQSFKDLELILIDNGSLDESRTITEKFCLKDSRIKLVSQKMVGIVHALNLGISKAKGKYIARMDADDISHPKRIQMQVDFLKNNLDVDLVSCKVNCIAEDLKNEGFSTYVDWVNSLLTPAQIHLNQFIESPLVHPSVMFRSELIAMHGPYRDGDFPEDYELWLRWLSKGVKIAKIEKILFDWYDRKNRLSRIDSRYSVDAFYRIKSVYLKLWLERNNPHYPNVVVWGAGKKSRKRLVYLEKEGIQVSAFIDIVKNRNLNKPYLYYKNIPAPGQFFILSYVGTRGARDKIRFFLQSREYTEGTDFLIVS